jgi:hypothetical protein
VVYPNARLSGQPLNAAGGSVEQPNRLEYLQLADIAASATAQAFEPDRHGNVEPRYVHELRPTIFRRGTGANSYTSYGMKIHPWNVRSRTAHDWLASW